MELLWAIRCVCKALLTGKYSLHNVQRCAFIGRDGVARCPNALEDLRQGVLLVALQSTQAQAFTVIGVYCHQHQHSHGHLCHVAQCRTALVASTLACAHHAPLWEQFRNSHFRASNIFGVQRMVRRAEADRQPWHNLPAAVAQAHDQPQEIAGARHAFVAARNYCIETMSHSCGRVIGWEKFTVAESPTNILAFLTRVYPQPTLLPSYVAVDKACQLLRHLTTTLSQHNLQEWQQQSRLIVDTYHFRNHKDTDVVCQEFCNPTPTIEEDCNLVREVEGVDGQVHVQRAFNTQVRCHEPIK